MDIVSERALEIDAYLAANKDNPKVHIGVWNLEISGEKQRLLFYKFPIQLLRYNIHNGRLAMEVKEWEKENGRKLDSNSKDDAEIIREKLLSLDAGKTNLLRDDLKKKGQMEPGVITYDGYVINGNRRMAILEQLHSETPTGKWEYLEAIRLPRSIGQKDLWKIEAGLQLSKEKVAEYHPVNELLKIKQGRDAGLEPKEIAAAMYGRTEKDVYEYLERLELIDQFLGFCGQVDNYGFIRKFGLHEHFVDIQNAVISSWKKQDMSAREQRRRLQQIFTLIRAGVLVQKNGRQKKQGITHWDIRDLAKISPISEAWETFTKNMQRAGKKPKDLLSIPAETIVDDFRNAQDVRKNFEDRGKPLLLIDRANRALNSIDRKSKHFKGERIKEALADLIDLAKELESILAQKDE